MIRIIGRINLILIFIVLSTFIVSCAAPIRYYKPLNEGDRVVRTSDTEGVIGMSGILLYEINNGVRVRIWVHFDDATDANKILNVGFIVPKEHSVQLASNEIKIESPEFNSHVTATVESIDEMEGFIDMYTYDEKKVKTEDGWTKVPPLSPDDQLYGYKAKNPSFYGLNFTFTNDNKDKDVTPSIVTIIFPEIFIDGELHKIEPLRFESTWTVIIFEPM